MVKDKNNLEKLEGEMKDLIEDAVNSSEIYEAEVKSFGNSAHLHASKRHIGKQARVIILDPSVKIRLHKVDFKELKEVEVKKK